MSDITFLLFYDSHSDHEVTIFKGTVVDARRKAMSIIRSSKTASPDVEVKYLTSKRTLQPAFWVSLYMGLFYAQDSAGSKWKLKEDGTLDRRI